MADFNMPASIFSKLCFQSFVFKALFYFQSLFQFISNPWQRYFMNLSIICHASLVSMFLAKKVNWFWHHWVYKTCWQRQWVKELYMLQHHWVHLNLIKDIEWISCICFILIGFTLVWLRKLSERVYMLWKHWVYKLV